MKRRVVLLWNGLQSLSKCLHLPRISTFQTKIRHQTCWGQRDLSSKLKSWTISKYRKWAGHKITSKPPLAAWTAKRSSSFHAIAAGRGSACGTTPLLPTNRRTRFWRHSFIFVRCATKNHLLRKPLPMPALSGRVLEGNPATMMLAVPAAAPFFFCFWETTQV